MSTSSVTIDWLQCITPNGKLTFCVIYVNVATVRHYESFKRLCNSFKHLQSTRRRLWKLIVADIEYEQLGGCCKRTFRRSVCDAHAVRLHCSRLLRLERHDGHCQRERGSHCGGVHSERSACRRLWRAARRARRYFAQRYNRGERCSAPSLWNGVNCRCAVGDRRIIAVQIILKAHFSAH